MGVYITKNCVICDVDVSRLKRAKDANGNYFCKPCWKMKMSRVVVQHHSTLSPTPSGTPPLVDRPNASTVPTTITGEEPPELLFCEGCNGRFAQQHLRLVTGRVVCKDCRAAEKNSRARDTRPPGVREGVWEVAIWERREMWLLVISLPLFPLAPILIPLNMYITFRLARSLGNNAWLWVAGSFVPWIGLLLLFALNFQAVSYLKSQGLQIRPFARRWRRERERPI